MKRVLIFFTVITLGACVKKNDNVLPVVGPMQVKLAPPVSKNDTVTYLALGDSYTLGFGIAQNQSYPNQLADQLRGQNYHVADPL